MNKAKEAAKKDNGSAEYLDFIKKAKELPYGLSKQGKSAGKDGQTCFYGNGIKIKKDYGSSAGPLTRLLTGYLSAGETDVLKSTGVKIRKRILPENISSDIENKEEIKTIINAYSETNEYIEKFYKNRWKKTEDFDGHIITLANLHYGDLDNRFGNSEKTVSDVLDDTYSLFWDLACENKGGDEIFDRFNEFAPQWHFTPKEDRIALLCKIIGKEITDENVMHLLTDFSCRGYFYLPYFIRDTISEYRSISDSDLKESKKDFDPGKNEYTQKFYSIFETGFNDKKLRKDIESEMISACRLYLRKKAAAYYDRQTKRFSPSLMKAVEEFDSKHDAFWVIFNSEEIKYALSGDEKSREVDQYVK